MSSSNRVVVGGLKEFITDDDLHHFFRRCGRIRQIVRKVDYAFVDFEDANGVEIAVRELHNTVLSSCTVTVEPVIFNREAELAVISNNNGRAFYAHPFRSRWYRNSAKTVSQRDSFNSSRSVRNMTPVRAINPTSSTFGCKSPRKSDLAVKLETFSPIQSYSDTIIQRVEQILLDGNITPKPTAEVEGIGLSELAKRPKIALHPEIGKTGDTRRATITDTTTNKYETPDCFSDCKVVVEGKVLHANKSLLSIYSAKLHNLFNSATSDEITLSENFGLEEVLAILDFIYPSSKQVTAANLECLLSIANKLEVSSVTAQCELFLSSESTFSLTKKIYLAQLYGLHSFQTDCINHCNSIDKLRLLKTEEEYELLDGKTMRLLIDNATADI